MSCSKAIESLFRQCEKVLTGSETTTKIDLGQLYDGEPYRVVEKTREGFIFIDLELVEKQIRPCVRFVSRSSVMWEKFYDKNLYITFQVMAHLLKDEYDREMAECLPD